MNERKKTLHVNKGIEAPAPLNETLLNQIRSRKIKMLSCDAYYKGILDGQVNILGQAITLVESTLAAHREVAEELIERCMPHSGGAIRIGITGVPGVGKSTFIESLGKHITQQGHKLAVLAIDPSSRKSKGSILGDKTRMESLSAEPSVFIRPSPSAGSLGGVARKTRESIILCEAAGYDAIFIETVGVGQSETTVKEMVDFFLLLMLAGAGDELQGIKRGIMEMADMVAINKADGNNYQNALNAKAAYANALHFFPPNESGWTPRTEVCSALTGFGIDKIWTQVNDYKTFTETNNYFYTNRLQQQKKCLHDTIIEEMTTRLFEKSETSLLLKQLEKALEDGRMSPYKAAQKVMKSFVKM